MKSINNQPVTNKKIVGVIAILLSLGILLILLTNISINLLSAARGFVDGKGIWTTAQKNAVLELIHYVKYEDTANYQKFDNYFEVNRGYQQAREELRSENPDPQIVLEGFQKGGRYNPEDIDNIIWIYQNFGWSPYLQQATDIWKETEHLMLDLEQLGMLVHSDIQSGTLSEAETKRYFKDIFKLDAQLTVHGERFASTISQASLMITRAVYWATLGIGFFFLISAGFVTILFLKNIKEWGELASKSQKKFRHVLENTQDILYELNVNKSAYEYVSPAVKKVLGYSDDILLKEGPEFIFNRIHPEDLEKLDNELEQIKGETPVSNFSHAVEYRIKNKDGDYIWVNNNRSVFLDEGKNAHTVVGSVRNINERKKYEKKINESLKEKEILLQEIHHRVKNNLAIITSLLELQKDEIDDEQMLNIFSKSQSRIKSIAMVHEKLYQTDTLSQVDMSTYIEEFSQILSKAYQSDQQKIEVQLNLQQVHLDINDAVPCGLIFNELANNAFKHAFTNINKGVLKVTLASDNGNVRLSVADNGHGMPENFSFDNTQSLGMTLLKTLTKQINGDISISSKNGWTEFTITF